MLEQNTETKSRLIAKIVWQLLKSDGPFEALADLTDVLKHRLARLRIKWTPTEISEAYALIETNSALVLPRAEPSPEPSPPAPICTPEAAADNRLRLARLIAGSLKPMPRTRAQIDIYAPVERQDTEHDRY